MTRQTTIADYLRATAVAAWGLSFAWLLLSGQLTTYLSPSLWWLALGGLIMALAFMVGLFVTTGTDLFHTHSSPTNAISRFAIMCFPLAYMMMGSPARSLGSHDLQNRSLDELFAGRPTKQANAQPAQPPKASQPSASQAAAAPPSEPADPAAPVSFDEMNIMNIVYDLMEPDDVLHVETVGMFGRSSRVPAGHGVLFRFVMTCCAADAQPVAVVLKADDLADLAEDQWIRVTGTARLTEVDGRERPLLTAESVEKIDPPSNPYLSPY